MRAPTDAAIASEVDALDKIHAVLDLPKNKRGLLQSEIAAQTGIAVGRVKEILLSSELVLRRRARHPNLWYNNWKEIEPSFRPKKTRDRRGRQPTQRIVVAPVFICPHCSQKGMLNEPSKLLLENPPGSLRRGLGSADSVRHN